MSMTQRLVTKSVESVYNLGSLNQDVQLSIRGNNYFFAVNELMETGVVLLNYMKRVFFIYVNALRENNIP